MTAKLAQNRCVNCDHTWEDHPGVFAVNKECPKCGSDYWLWENYHDFDLTRRASSPVIRNGKIVEG